jgi:hypothetical protein
MKHYETFYGKERHSVTKPRNDRHQSDKPICSNKY